MIVEISGVEHDYESIGPTLPIEAPQHHVARDRFVEAVGIQTIRTGQIDHFHRASIGECRPAGFAFDGNAGIICNFLPRAS